MNIQEKIASYLKMNRSPKTIQTYGEALKVYARLVGDRELTAETYAAFLQKIKDLNPSTQALYRSAVRGLYVDASTVPMAEIKKAEKKWVRRRGQRLINFDRGAIEYVIGYTKSLKSDLAALRDRAFILTLADTGLRISEACALRRGDIDRLEQRALVVGKGDKQAVVRFSRRSLDAIDDYLRARKDSASGKPLTSLPLFARHDKGAGKKIKPVESGGMWKAVKRRARESGIDPTSIRVHDFRHYFVTMLILAGGKTEAVRKAARHASSSTTSRYIHLLDSEVDELYDEAINRNG